ncbi:MAG: hypothetical protein RQ757_06215 [Pseudomonadales bacterium]|nr:hypothetical protein [Pseudomonadales bacterium]
MNLEHFQYLLETHGADCQHWPGQEPGQVEAFIAATPAAEAMLKQALWLDALLADIASNTEFTDIAGLQRKILARELPPQPTSVMQRLLNWISPRQDQFLQTFWRPALLACLPLVFGLYLGTQFSFGIEEIPNDWEEELMLLSLNDYAEPLP